MTSFDNLTREDLLRKLEGGDDDPSGDRPEQVSKIVQSMINLSFDWKELQDKKNGRENDLEEHENVESMMESMMEAMGEDESTRKHILGLTKIRLIEIDAIKTELSKRSEAKYEAAKAQAEKEYEQVVEQINLELAAAVEQANLMLEAEVKQADLELAAAVKQADLIRAAAVKQADLTRAAATEKLDAEIKAKVEALANIPDEDLNERTVASLMESWAEDTSDEKAAETGIEKAEG